MGRPPKSKKFSRLCAGCLADAVVRQALTAKVIFFQPHQHCDRCEEGTSALGVFVADLQDPLRNLFASDAAKFATSITKT